MSHDKRPRVDFLNISKIWKLTTTNRNSPAELAAKSASACRASPFCRCKQIKSLLGTKIANRHGRQEPPQGRSHFERHLYCGLLLRLRISSVSNGLAQAKAREVGPKIARNSTTNWPHGQWTIVRQPTRMVIHSAEINLYVEKTPLLRISSADKRSNLNFNDTHGNSSQSPGFIRGTQFLNGI